MSRKELEALGFTLKWTSELHSFEVYELILGNKPVQLNRFTNSNFVSISGPKKDFCGYWNTIQPVVDSLKDFTEI